MTKINTASKEIAKATKAVEKSSEIVKAKRTALAFAIAEHKTNAQTLKDLVKAEKQAKKEAKLAAKAAKASK